MQVLIKYGVPGSSSSGQTNRSTGSVREIRLLLGSSGPARVGRGTVAKPEADQEGRFARNYRPCPEASGARLDASKERSP